MKEDPLIKFEASLKTFKTLNTLSMLLNKEEVIELSFPLLFLHGKENCLVLASHAKSVLKKIRFKDKIFLPIKNGRHEIFHDKDRVVVRHIILKWLLNKAESAKPFAISGKIFYDVVQ